MSEMTTLNIVELIEQNPITRLSKTYQNKLITKIQQHFSNEEQQLFVTSFYTYLNYNAKTDFIIDLDDIWKWLGFSNKDKSKRLLEKSFIINIDYKIIAQLNDNLKIGRGGHNKETIFLTVKAFKSFCLKAGTKKADQIHEYYLKLEETLHELINEDSNELKLQVETLQNTLVVNKNEYDQKLIKEKALEKQNILLREFGNAGPLVYIIRVKSYETGEYVVKIGQSSRGVQGRYNEHKSKYEEAILLDCFVVKRSRDLENFIHSHKDVKLSNVTDLPGHEQERELFLIGKRLSYAILINIIKMNLQQFNDYNIDKILTENEVLTNLLSLQKNNATQECTIAKQLMDMQNTLLQNTQILLAKVSSLEQSNKEILEKLYSTQTRTTTHFEEPLSTIGPRLQQIHPETLQLIKVYESVTQCMREDSRMKRPSLHKAIQENTVYNGFRWLYVDRELDPNVIHQITQTRITKAQNLGYIAKLNSTKTEIINVYLDRKTAAAKNGYASISALDNPVKNGTIANGHYYVLYDKCTPELKEDFVNRNSGEPLLYKDGVGQYDAQNTLVQEFACKYDCIRKLSISDKTLAKAMKNRVPYNGYYYREIGSKLQCIV